MKPWFSLCISALILYIASFKFAGGGIKGLAMVGTGILLFGMLHFQETMNRPSPHLWRFFKAVSLAYFLFMCYYCSLSQYDARDLLKVVD